MTELQLLANSETMTVDSPRGLAARERLANVRPDASEWEAELGAVTMIVVDALIDGDVDALSTMSDPFRDKLADLFVDEGATREIRGWMLALLSVTRWSLLRLPSTEELRLTGSTHAAVFLRALHGGPPRSGEYLRRHLNTGHSQVSRVGRDLLARGLVVQRRLGREAVWELTPRGRQLLRSQQEHDQAPARVAAAHGRKAAQSSRTATRSARTDRGSARRRQNGGARRMLVTKGASKLPTGAELVRYVVPSDDGWRVVKDPKGRAVARARTKKAAIDRAKEIVGRSGGGVVETHDRAGNPERSISVARRRRS